MTGRDDRRLSELPNRLDTGCDAVSATGTGGGFDHTSAVLMQELTCVRKSLKCEFTISRGWNPL